MVTGPGSENSFVKSIRNETVYSKIFGNFSINANKVHQNIDTLNNDTNNNSDNEINNNDELLSNKNVKEMLIIDIKKAFNLLKSINHNFYIAL